MFEEGGAGARAARNCFCEILYRPRSGHEKERGVRRCRTSLPLFIGTLNLKKFSFMSTS